VYLGLGGENRTKKKPRKSLSRQYTFYADSSKEVFLEYLSKIAKKLEKDLIQMGNAKAKTISLTTKLNDFKIRNKTITLPYPIFTETDIFSQASNILYSLLPLNLRLIGVRLSNFENIKTSQTGTSISQYFQKLPQEGLESLFKKEENKTPPKRKSQTTSPVSKSKKRKSDPGQTTLDQFFKSSK